MIAVRVSGLSEEADCRSVLPALNQISPNKHFVHRIMYAFQGEIFTCIFDHTQI